MAFSFLGGAAVTSMTFARYFIRACVGAIGVAFVGLVVVGVTVRLVEQVGQLTERADAWTALSLAAYHAVDQGYQILPIATFFGVLVIGATWARHGELLGVGAAGIGPARLTAYALLVAVVTSGLGAGCGEYAVPGALGGVQRIYHDELGKGLGRIGAFFARRHLWYRFGDLVLHLPKVDVANKSFAEPQVYRFENGVIVEVTEARELRYADGEWILIDARRYSTQQARILTFDRLVLRHLPADDLFDITGHPRHMSTAAVSRLIDRRAAAGFDAAAHRIELHGRFAHPSLGLFLLLVAAPWVLVADRRRSLAVTLGGGVVLLGVVLAIGQTFRLLALAGRLPAPLGAWGAALTCLVVAPISWHLARRYGRG